ncbi:MAG: hypothetical protein QJR09_05250 [Micrococcus sp.]|nr:hypothetical protein [Micrococcus sp.]
MAFTPSIKQNVFEFHVKAQPRKKWQLPLRQYLPMTLAERLEENGLKLAKYKDELADMQGRIDAGEDVDLPEGFDPELLVELKAAQRAVFEKYCPGLYDVANQFEINEIMQEWGRVSNIDLGKSSASSGS